MSSASYEQELKDHGLIRQWSVEGSRPRHTFVAKCGCGSVTSAYYHTEPPPAIIAKKLSQRGWLLSRAENVCPVCIARRKMEKQEKKGMVSKDQELRVAALIGTHLAGVFLAEERRYKPGHTDETVGAELKMPPATVKRVREALYGEMGTDPEMSKIEADIKDMRAMLDELASRVARLKDRS